MTTEGWRIIGLHRGAPLPLDVNQEAIDHLSSHNLIESFTMTAPERQLLAEQPPGTLPEQDPGPAQQVPTPAPEGAKASTPAAAGSGSASGGTTGTKTRAHTSGSGGSK